MSASRRDMRLRLDGCSTGEESEDDGSSAPTLNIADTRSHVVAELFENEKCYVESLQMLIAKYLEPLKSSENSGIIEEALVDEIFYQIPFLLDHHQNFLDDMTKRLELWDEKQKIGDLFVQMFSKSEVTDCYTNYVNNWKRTREIIKHTQLTKPSFAKFIEAAGREQKGKLALDSLLIKPIQKFPKYELLLQRLLKHTDENHPDRKLLVIAQRAVHEQLSRINCTEQQQRNCLSQTSSSNGDPQEQLRELESSIEGLTDLTSCMERRYIRTDSVTIGSHRDRYLILLSDLLLITTKRKGTCQKLLMRLPLDDLELRPIAGEEAVPASDCINDQRQRQRPRHHSLVDDLETINRISELARTLRCTSRGPLEEILREMTSSLNKQLAERQSATAVDSLLCRLDLAVGLANCQEFIPLEFPTAEKRALWEESFLEAKCNRSTTITTPLVGSSGEKFATPPGLIATVPVRKTRAGLQFTCAAPAPEGARQVWVCNSDGYVGQVCVLTLTPEPTVTSCNGVCSARILSVASVPPPPPRSSNSTPNKRSNGDVQDEEIKGHLDNSSSSEDEANDLEEDQKSNTQVSTSTSDKKFSLSTIWLGTEDGFIHIYNSSENIRTKKNKIKIQVHSAVLSIVYLDNRVYVSLANGDVTMYHRDQCTGGWKLESPTRVSLGSTTKPILRMVPQGSDRVWCSCGNAIKVLDSCSLAVVTTFTVNSGNGPKPITCIVLSNSGHVWLSVQNSSTVKCYQAATFEPICEVNVAPTVAKMLASCDDIIKQHKSACLRVTALLICNETLWIGTSAGVLLTMPLQWPKSQPVVAGLPYGHTGHVRFLTSVQVPDDSDGSVTTMVISGGDGYEDFHSINLSEAAGREDSTNHLLLWAI